MRKRTSSEDREERQGFLSYAHADEDYLRGMVGALRDELKQAVRFVTGRPFSIFLDKDGIAWGKVWRKRLEEALGEARFLIPILTPSFFASKGCCDEVRLFRKFEVEAGRDDLILPIYLQQADVFDDDAARAQHDVAALLFERQFRRWPKDLIHEPPNSPTWRRRAYELAAEIHEIDKQIDAARDGVARSDRLRAERLAADLKVESSVNSVADPLAEAKAWAVQLNDEANKKQNSLPRSFPFRSLEACLKGILMLLAGASKKPSDGSSICDLGEQARFLLDFALALRDQSFAERPELEALEPLLQNLLAMIGEDADLPLMEGDPAPWPPGSQGPVQKLLDEIAEELEAIGSNVEDDERAPIDQARYHHSVLAREVPRDHPKWPSLRRSGLKLDESLRSVASAPFQDLQDLAGHLAGKLRETAEEVINGLPDFAAFQDLPDAPVMVIIPPGQFDMGSKDGEGNKTERPQHRVTFEHRLAIGRYPVTYGDYSAFAASTGHEGKGAFIKKGDEFKGDEEADWRSPGFEQTHRHPVVCVNWEDAKDYVAWLSAGTGMTYRLPSEAFWEFSCRAGSTTSYSFGETISDAQANFDSHVGQTSLVGSYPANNWGLCDMHGNVWEWVEDTFHGSYEGAPTDGSAWIGGTNSERVLRGGSWIDGPGDLRSAGRYGGNPGVRSDFVGFRVSRTLTS